MLNDFIHLTQGELLVKYWWLWSFILAGAGISLWWDNRKYR